MEKTRSVEEDLAAAPCSIDRDDKLTWDISYLDGTFASAKKGDPK